MLYVPRGRLEVVKIPIPALSRRACPSILAPFLKFTIEPGTSGLPAVPPTTAVKVTDAPGIVVPVESVKAVVLVSLETIVSEMGVEVLARLDKSP